MQETKDPSGLGRPEHSADNDATVISLRPGSQRPDEVAGSTAPRPPAGPGGTAEIGRLLAGTMLGPYRLDEFVGGVAWGPSSVPSTPPSIARWP